jgi:elongation factor Ts
MAYTAADVKKLRELTQAGMMDCKKALDETDGDFDKAVELLRVKGAAKAAARAAERETSAGLVANAGNAIVALLAETDFVAKNQAFIDAAQKIAEAADANKVGDTETLRGVTVGDTTVGEIVDELARTIGEKIELGEVAYVEGNAAVYMHKRSADLPAAIGEYAGDADLARKAAMQGASMKAKWLSVDDVPADIVASEKDVLTKKTLEEGKPEAAVAKIVEGRIGAFFKENVLLEQEAFVFESKDSVGKVLAAADTKVTKYARIEVGA